MQSTFTENYEQLEAQFLHDPLALLIPKLATVTLT